MVAEIHSNASMEPGKIDLVGPWVAKQRWFQGKGRTPQFHRTSAFRLADPSGQVGVEIMFLRDVTSGENTTYQIPVTYRGERVPELEHALIGTSEHSVLGTRYFYDGPHDPVFAAALLDVMVNAGTEEERSDGVVEMTVKGRPSPRGAGLPRMRSAKVLSGEQSNTSIIYTLDDGSQLIAKVFRVLHVGSNPDIEITNALTAAGNQHVPALYASLAGSYSEGRHSRERVTADLAFAQEFLPNVRDAWREALEAARDNRDFTEGARALGRTTAEVHRTLAEVLPTAEPDANRISDLVDEMHERAAAAFHEAEHLAQHTTAVSARIEASRGATWPAFQRIHGDYHLGQVLNVTERGWVLLDFEGEPLRPLDERTNPDVTVRDVAGMLRSFDYAGGTIENEQPGVDGDRRAWVGATQAAFLEGYEREAGASVPRDLLDLFVLDKALYEISYEARNRPDWLSIPANAVVRILEAAPQASEVHAMSAHPVTPLADTGDAAAGIDERSTMNSENTPPPVTTRGVPATDDATVAEPGSKPDAAGTGVVSSVVGATKDLAAQAGSALGMDTERSGGEVRPASVDTNELNVVLAGEHRDPHRVLGAHVAHGVITFRVVRPMARTVTVEMGDQRVELTHEYEGIWVGATAGEHMPDYRILTTYEDGAEQRGDDPYRFMPTLGEIDLHLIGEGRHEELWNVLGAHVRTYPSVMGDVTGTSFAVWAPNAKAVRVVGDFNHWDGVGHGMRTLSNSGVWELFVPDVHEGTAYKFEILCSDGVRRAKADPMARLAETAPATASKVTSSHYEWNDSAWMTKRAETDPHHGPMSTYEVHLGSWRQGQSYRDLAEHLVNYVMDLGFTHVEFMPVMEHPYPPSWGYHVTSYYAPNSRFGDPDDFKFLVDRLHQEGIGVILDWVPGHFATDEWALARFDGQALYEHPDPRKGWHPEWGSNIFDYGRPQVRNFLVANALYWLEEFHADGLRVDGVASMLYLNYARKDGEWEPNKFGGQENLEAVQLLQETNATAYKRTPGVVIVAEESTSWPGITRSTDSGGLGFGLKWNMGWMHDSLDYVAREPIYRQHHHHDLTFALVYAFSEQFVLPISHDEVVHGKGSLLRKMPGDRWQQLAGVRAYLAYMWAHPGKPLLFMGSEFAQEAEWADGRSLDWWLLDQPAHYGVHAMMKDLNRAYRERPAMWALDHSGEGFRWINADDADRNAYTWLRFAEAESDGYRPVVAVAANFAGSPHENVRVGLPHAGTWNEILNTDAQAYGGSGVGNLGSVVAEEIPWDGQPYSAEITMPPLGVVWFEPATRPDMTQVAAHTATEQAGGADSSSTATARQENTMSDQNAATSSSDRQPSEALIAGAPLEDAAGNPGALDQPLDGSRGGAQAEDAQGAAGDQQASSRTGVPAMHPVDHADEGGFDIEQTESKAHERAFTPAGEDETGDEPVEHLKDITGTPGGGLDEDVEGGRWGPDDEARDAADETRQRD
ncbi:1,4-alpha-glucan branching protein GlgB [Dermacoccus barathri]|uniref:1,4-alpha-glucan branching protein GlgB n=1 Tax=Dermacoccus barathri TaxID=322601 RepID=UPI0039E73E58